MRCLAGCFSWLRTSSYIYIYIKINILLLGIYVYPKYTLGIGSIGPSVPGGGTDPQGELHS